MPMISVRAKKDVVAFTAPRGGLRIPHDKFMQVDASPYLYRLARHWGDIEIEGEGEKKADAQPKADAAPVAKAKGDAAAAT